MHGVRIDDFFYQLKKQSKHANASLQLIFTIIIGQLPKEIHGKAKTFFADKRIAAGNISEINGRALISRIKEWMSERGITFDIRL